MIKTNGNACELLQKLREGRAKICYDLGVCFTLPGGPANLFHTTLTWACVLLTCASTMGWNRLGKWLLVTISRAESFLLKKRWRFQLLNLDLTGTQSSPFLENGVPTSSQPNWTSTPSLLLAWVLATTPGTTTSRLPNSSVYSFATAIIPLISHYRTLTLPEAITPTWHMGWTLHYADRHRLGSKLVFVNPY